MRQVLKKCLESLISLFSLKYSSNVKKKRKYILYFALQLIMEKPNYNIEIMSENTKNLIKTVSKNINSIYKKIKKNEDAPNTNYLFKDTNNNKSNLEKTIEKLDVMNKIIKI